MNVSEPVNYSQRHYALEILLMPYTKELSAEDVLMKHMIPMKILKYDKQNVRPMILLGKNFSSHTKGSKTRKGVRINRVCKLE